MGDKINLELPGKPSDRHTVLGLRNNRLQWFTQKGWDLLSDRIEFSKQGQKVRVKKDGWVKVDPNDCVPRPAPLTADQVKPGAKEVKTVTGGDAKKEANEKTVDVQPGDTGEVSDKGQANAGGAKEVKADSKPGKA